MASTNLTSKASGDKFLELCAVSEVSLEAGISQVLAKAVARFGLDIEQVMNKSILSLSFSQPETEVLPVTEFHFDTMDPDFELNETAFEK